MNFKTWTWVCAVGLSILGWTVPANAQPYPNKPVKLVVGYAAGGAVDIIARTVGQAMSGSMGQPVVVENKPGAGTNIAVKSVIAADPDGYTLMMAANALAANMSLYQPQPFDAEKDVVAVSLVGRVPVVIAANPAVPYGNVKQLIESAKGKPNSIAYGSPGNGSTPHMAIELFARAAGIDLQHVPYRGGAQALTDVIGGQLPLVALNALEVQPHVKSGKLKVIGTSAKKRLESMPDIPTFREAGLNGLDFSPWEGILAPAKTPTAIVNRLNEETVKALRNPAIVEKLAKLGVDQMIMTPEDMDAMVKAEVEAAGPLAKAAGIAAK